MQVLRRQQFQHEELKSKSGTGYSMSAVLDAAGTKDLFIHHEIVPPGRSTSAPHLHQLVDEFVFVIKGKITAIEGDKSEILSVGDCAWFLAGTNQLHYLKNDSSEVAEILVVTKKTTESDIKF